MIRLHFVVEGQTEEAFVNSVLADHLGCANVFADVRCVETSRQGARIFRGGALASKRIPISASLFWKARLQTMWRTDGLFPTCSCTNLKPCCYLIQRSLRQGLSSIRKAFRI
jgi:hypothetical protein